MKPNARHIVAYTLEDALVIEVLCQHLNDYDMAAELRDQILAAMQHAQSDRVILDLRNVELLTSVALFPLIEIRAEAEREGRRVVLCNVATPVAQALTVSQLIVENRPYARHLVLTEDIPAAIEWLNSGDTATRHDTRLATSASRSMGVVQ
jgi:anti-anti-sigma factor